MGQFRPARGPPYQPCPNVHPPPHQHRFPCAHWVHPPPLHYWLGRGQADKELCSGSALCSPRSDCRVTTAVCHRQITEQIQSCWFCRIQTPIMGHNASALQQKIHLLARIDKKVWLWSLSDCCCVIVLLLLFACSCQKATLKPMLTQSTEAFLSDPAINIVCWEMCLLC